MTTARTDIHLLTGLRRARRRTWARIALPRSRAVRIKRTAFARRLRGLAIAWLMLPQFAALTWFSLTAAPWQATLCGVLLYLSDYYLHRHEKPLLKKLARLRLTLPLRISTIGMCLCIPLVAQLGLHSTPARVTLACMLAWIMGQPLYSGQVQAITRLRQAPVVTRRIQLPCYDQTLRLAPPPSRLTKNEGRRLLHQLLLVLAGYAAWPATGNAWTAALGTIAALAWSLTASLLLLPALLRALRLPRPQQVIRETEQWLHTYAPEIILYFSGDRSTAYQANMWLPVLEHLQARPLILIRERHLIPLLDPTTTPLLCVPDNDTLINLTLPDSVKAALYPTNVGRNIHFHRRSAFPHVFIGHGDSDKTPSTNPVIRMYNEIWVAGHGHQERLSRAGLGIPDTNIVHVGRPQLDTLTAHTGRSAPHFSLTGQHIPTVLYAPTWEGWADTPGATSLLEAGERIVRQLLYGSSPVRLIYRPHPYTGRRDPRARRTHQRIADMIEKANRKRAKDPRYGATAQDHRRPEHEVALRRLQHEAATMREQLTGQGDELAAAARLATADPAALHASRERNARAEAAYWNHSPWWEHRIVEPADASLYATFAETDLLIADISSVVSEYIATHKPYAIVNSTGSSTETFREENTAARAGYVLGPRGQGCASLVRLLYDRDRHTLQHHQAALRTYLLGPEHPTATDRFVQAVEALCGRAGRPRADRPADEDGTERRRTSEPEDRTPVPQEHRPVGDLLGPVGKGPGPLPCAPAAAALPRPDAPSFAAESLQGPAEGPSSTEPSHVPLSDLFADMRIAPSHAEQELPASGRSHREGHKEGPAESTAVPRGTEVCG